jgi:hypothetical protein
MSRSSGALNNASKGTKAGDGGDKGVAATRTLQLNQKLPGPKYFRE